jgi:hypothetical protein
MLPNARRFEDCKIWLPKCNGMRTRPGWIEPEIYFRINHGAVQGLQRDPMAAYREQTVEIALGPKGALENGNIGAMTRRVPAEHVVSAVPPCRGNPKPPREPPGAPGGGTPPQGDQVASSPGIRTAFFVPS